MAAASSRWIHNPRQKIERVDLKLLFQNFTLNQID